MRSWIECTRCETGQPYPGLLDLAWPVLAWFTSRVFSEDCAIVEMEEAAYDEQGADWNQEVFAPIRQLRKLLRECGESPLSPPANSPVVS